jgi:hypothetical protein
MSEVVTDEILMKMHCMNEGGHVTKRQEFSTPRTNGNKNVRKDLS